MNIQLATQDILTRIDTYVRPVLGLTLDELRKEIEYILKDRFQDAKGAEEVCNPSPSETRTEYVIVEQLNAEALSVHVNRLIDLGWKPLGGVCITPLGSARWYSQGMEKQVISGQK